jgi:hypothetical protein
VEFLSWIDRVAADTPVLNPPQLIAWSMDKRCLRDLAAEGVACARTTFLEPGDAWSLPESSEYVVKPTDSAGSRNTARYGPGDATRADAHIRRLHAEGRCVMVQPYVTSVDEEGESALLFFDGAFSHSARKGPLLSRAAPVTELLFIQEAMSPRRASPEELAVAEAALTAASARTGVWPPLYARVDLVADATGAPMVLELEMVEPSVFLATDPQAAARFADAVDARVTPRIRPA